MNAPNWKKTCPLDFEQVTKAVKALKEYISKTQKKNEKGFLEEHNDIQLQILLHKIPAVKNKTSFIELPHSLYPESTEICLITRDHGGPGPGSDPEKTIEKWQKLFKKHGVERISKVMPLKELRSDYGAYDARRRLLTMYDLFLCEESLIHRMPNLLGKIFFGVKKDPWPVAMYGKHMKQEIERAINHTRWVISGEGSSSLITAARTNFSVEQIVENVMSCAVGIARFVPRGWNNVRAVHIRTDNSIALPIFYNDCRVDVNDLDFSEIGYLVRNKQHAASKKRILNLIGSKKISHKRHKLGDTLDDEESEKVPRRRKRIKLDMEDDF